MWEDRESTKLTDCKTVEAYCEEWAHRDYAYDAEADDCVQTKKKPVMQDHKLALKSKVEAATDDKIFKVIKPKEVYHLCGRDSSEIWSILNDYHLDSL